MCQNTKVRKDESVDQIMHESSEKREGGRTELRAGLERDI